MTDTLLLDLETGVSQDSSLSEECTTQLEQVMEQDRLFFLQHPEQDYYMRPIAPVEVVEGQQIGRALPEKVRVLVGQIVPGSRIRLTFIDDGTPPPIAEFKRICKQLRQERGATSDGLKERLKHQGKGRSPAKGFG